MNIIPWKNKGNESGELPARREDRFGADFDQLVQRFFDDPWAFPAWPGGPAAERDTAFVPRLEMSETDDEIMVRAELPGIDPKAIDLTVSGDMLTISGEKTSKREDERESYVLNERAFGRFERSVTLPGHVDIAAISAEYENGVLVVHLPRTEDVKPRKIQVKAR